MHVRVPKVCDVLFHRGLTLVAGLVEMKKKRRRSVSPRALPIQKAQDRLSLVHVPPPRS